MKTFHSLISLSLIIVVVLLQPSCKKPENQVKPIAKNYAHVADGAETTIDVTDENTTYNHVRYTVVGAQYDFPFKTETIRQAWNALSENDITTLSPTHNYIKFTPETPEELAEVLNSGLHVFDFPLDHEITQYGDVLDGTTASSIPVLYTFAPVDEALPDVSHEVLFTVYFTEMESVVTEKAFEIAGLADKYPYNRSDNPDTHFDTVPAILDAIKPTHDSWTIPTLTEPYTGGAGGYSGGGLDFNTPTPWDVRDACACDRNSDDREPSGCVLVEETRFAPNWEGVRKVAVDFIGPYGQYDIIWTGERGCFRSGKKMYYKVWRPSWLGGDYKLPVAMRVVFMSGEATVRSLVPGTMFLAMQPVAHVVGDVSGWGLNNITIRYNRSANAWQLPNVYYCAATVNNSHYQVKDMCWQDGITPMPSDMNYLIQPFSGPSGSTPMLRQMIKSGTPSNIISQSTVLYMFKQIPVIGFNLETYLRATPPDMSIGSNMGSTNASYESDDMRLLIYHEMGHAIHYRKTSNQFWRNLLDFETARSLQSWGTDPYGNGTDAGADRCSFAEMWGDHIGYTYVHRRYGINHSRGGITVADRIDNSWYERIESSIGMPGFPQYSWIPSGLLHDLMDNNLNNIALSSGLIDNAAMGASPGVNDNVGGFTMQMLYNELGAGNISQYRDNLRNNQLPATGNSVAAFNTLMAVYGL